VREDEPVAQADLEARMNELSAAGGGAIDMGGARVLITEPPLDVPPGIWLSGCHFEVHLERPCAGEDWSASYKLPDFATGEAGSGISGHVQVDDRGHVYVQVNGGGSVDGVDGILLPDGGILAEVPREG